MGIQTARSNVGWLQKSAAHYNQLPTAPTSRKVCTYWLKGKCNRNPCRFLHDASLPRNVYHRAAKQSSYMREDCPGKGPESSPVNSASSTSRERGDSSKDKNPQKPQEKVCNYWMSDNCVKGNACPFLHSWFHGIDFALLAKLEGHKKGVSGISLPSGSNKLYSGSKDGTARIWDCHTGQCVQVINLGGEVGCFTCEGPWVFVGMPNTVKAWNIQNGASYDISGPVGQVHAMEVANNMLFAGAQDGTILVWKEGSEADTFQMAAPLRGHTWGVVSLTVGRDRLYSGSIDQTIRVWDLHTLECVQELVGHTDVVMSLLCWDQYLLSCSLDQTVKIWGATEDCSLEVVYTHHEDHGILALSGMLDAGGKPVLLCACIDNTVRLYELPSFTERGKIFSRREVRTLQTAPGGLFFTGDAAGMLTVWNWLDSPKSQEEQLPHSMESC
ncbi:zinc finger CCCH domain-containing protein 48-like [Syzygium oleosum]|uniref:zinc finger CCCH domain-containing protein 48-like n=1 Tax=Syzygium oleosum TaxID=219896 RepID=UPI0024BAECA2|nr:zinc finger CCCH domain-containing protein 48-like [Syzygium oleosum]